MRISQRFRKGLATLMLLGACCAPAWAKAPWEAGNRYALIVGIDDYQNESVVDLKCATSDAKLLKDTLVKSGEVAEDNIFLLTSDAPGESSKPSLTNVVFRLEWLREIVGPGDTLVFYFAGHGVSMDGKTFLLTEEADQRSKNTLMVSSLPGEVLNDLLKSAGAQNTLVLLDACRNDPTAGRGDADNRLSEQMARGLVFKPKEAAAPELARNTATVFACSEGQRSFEWTDKKQGFFTYYLSEALSKGAFDTEGKATLQSLVGYLRDKVNAAALREANQAQTPMLSYEGPGAERWVLARNLSAAPKPEEVASAAKLAEVAAEVQAKDLALRAEKDRAAKAEAEKARLAAENEMLKAEKALLAAQKDGGDVAKAQKDLEFAKDMKLLADQGADASGQFVASSESLKLEAETRAQTAQIAQKVAVFGAQGGSPELDSLKSQLSELEAKLAKMDEERKAAVERAFQAEKRVATLEKQLAEKWKGRMRGKRPTMRRKAEAFMEFVTSPEEEAESLENGIED